MRVLLLSAFLLMGCGIKGPPLPPVTEQTIQKDKLESELSETKANTTAAPAKSSDATPAKPLKK